MEYIQKNKIKGFKPFLIKHLALFISICYLANPLQSQVSILFHEISHLLEAPNVVVGHSTVSDHGHDTHQYQEHTFVDDNHEHMLIDFLNAIFNASNDGEGSPENSILTNIKIDKHITSDEYLVKKTYLIEKDVDFISAENDVTKGHPRVLKEPPQSFSL